jgi:hypothetical protein
MTSPRTRTASTLNLFASSSIISLIALVVVAITMGFQAMLVTLMLMVIEITFSFDNAIINAKVLATMSPFWQRIFMTIGILVAVFGMRIVFPVLVVMVSTGLPWQHVVDLALHHANAYAEVLRGAHTAIAAFGGMFLLMLCLHFLFDASRPIHWIAAIERPLQRVARWWLPALTSIGVLVVVAFIPLNHHMQATLGAGTVGILTYLALAGLAAVFERFHTRSEQRAGRALQKVGMAGFAAFIYLEVLDASFSLDGVIGAFAITQNVILIAIGLGVGALWVRSLTLFMVRRQLLHAYRYLEHGAHYTIGALAVLLLVGLFYEIPEYAAGSIGIIIIGLSIMTSKAADERSLSS